MILGIGALFGPSFPKVSWCPKYPKTGETLPSTGFYTWVMLQLMWNVGFKTFYEFLYIQSPWFGVFGPSFPDLCQCPKYTKTGINQPSDSLYIWVRFNLEFKCEMWSLTLWIMTSVYQCWWCGVLGFNLSNLPQFPKYTKTGITWPADGLYPWVRLHLMWNLEFNTLNGFQSISGLNFANLPQFHKYKKQV